MPVLIYLNYKKLAFFSKNGLNIPKYAKYPKYSLTVEIFSVMQKKIFSCELGTQQNVHNFYPRETIYSAYTQQKYIKTYKTQPYLYCLHDIMIYYVRDVK